MTFEKIKNKLNPFLVFIVSPKDAKQNQMLKYDKFSLAISHSLGKTFKPIL